MRNPPSGKVLRAGEKTDFPTESGKVLGSAEPASTLASTHNAVQLLLSSGLRAADLRDKSGPGAAPSTAGPEAANGRPREVPTTDQHSYATFPASLGYVQIFPGECFQNDELQPR